MLLKNLRTRETEIKLLTAELENTKQKLQESQQQMRNAGLRHSVEVSQINLRFADERNTLSSKVCETEAELTAARKQVSTLSEKDNKLTTQILEKERHLAEKDICLAEKDFKLVQIQQEFRETLLIKDQLLVEKDQHLEASRQKQTELDVLLLSKIATLGSKESLVASKDETIRRLDEQLDNLKKSLYTAEVSEKTTEVRNGIIISMSIT